MGRRMVGTVKGEGRRCFRPLWHSKGHGGGGSSSSQSRRCLSFQARQGGRGGRCRRGGFRGRFVNARSMMLFLVPTKPFARVV